MARVAVELTGFTVALLEEQAEAEGVSLEEVVRQAIAYYIADLDAGRIAARPPRQPLSGEVRQAGSTATR